MTQVIRVETSQPYEVVVGRDVLGALPSHLGDSVEKVALLHPRDLSERAAAVATHLRASGRQVVDVALPDAEDAKTAAVTQLCWERLGEAGFTRSDLVVSLGGGATTDLAGFVAATWVRGIAVIHLPTTLLAMVDAAVGGKTGINTAAGKNLVGAIHEPRAVLCDLDFLLTLPPRDLAAGAAEIVKAGFIRDTSILDLFAQPGVLDPASAQLATAVCRAIQVKADVVAGDLRETSRALGGREILNYGHTLGHAIERLQGYRWRHGDAVSVGMVFAAELARLTGQLSAEVVELHREILSRIGLPISYRGSFRQLLDAMALDKKARGSRLRFVVLAGLGEPVFLDGPEPDLLAAAFARISQ
ncbi:MAG: 3-dehydroquinate synthase [Candidatus Nanopelagicales bacterium]